MSTTPVKHKQPSPPDRAQKPSRPHLDSYYTRISGHFRATKYITVIILSAFLIFSFTFLRSDITLENLRYLLKFISFTNTETSITASKINYASGDPNRLELFIGDLCTLSPEGYALYDSRGNQIMAENIKYALPVLKTGDRFTLCYDLDGTAFTVLNTFSKLYEGTTEYPITDGAISSEGSFAIASSSREYRTAITLYDSDFEAVTRIYKNDHLMALEIKDDATELAVMTAGARNGAFYTKIELIAPGKDKELHSCELSGLGYSLYYTDSGFAVVTDESICFLNSELELMRAYRHDSRLAMSDASGKYIICAHSDSVMGNSSRACVYTADGRLVFEGSFDGKLIAMDFDESGEYIFILAGTTVSRINLINDKIGTFTVEADAIDILAQSPESVLICKKNYALTYEPKDFTEHYFDRVGAAPKPEDTEDTTHKAGADTSEATEETSADTAAQTAAETSVETTEAETDADTVTITEETQ